MLKSVHDREDSEVVFAIQCSVLIEGGSLKGSNHRREEKKSSLELSTNEVIGVVKYSAMVQNGVAHSVTRDMLPRATR